MKKSRLVPTFGWCQSIRFRPRFSEVRCWVSRLFDVSACPRSALIKSLSTAPYSMEGPGNKAIESQANVDNAIADLDQARCLFSLVGLSTASPQWWVQPTDWLMSAGVGGVTFLGEGISLLTDALIYPEDATRLATSHFAIDKTLRHNVLRIPLDRLDRAGRVRDFADKAIDLGIALEALLLHDAKGGEKSFRMSLRGAWLAGADENERVEIGVRNLTNELG